MKIILDGDSLPFKKNIIETAQKHGIKIIMVLSIAHYTEKAEYASAEKIYVDSENQAADIKIANIAEKGDIVITNDTGLAYLVCGRGAVVITGKGRLLSTAEMDMKIQQVHIMKKVFRAGTGKAKIRGEKAFDKKDAQRLITVLERAIQKPGEKSDSRG